MIISHAPSAALGFSLKKVAKKVGHGVKTASLAPIKATIAVTKYATSLALKPITNRLHAMTDRRAHKLAMERRRSKTPTTQERTEARAWTKHSLSAHGPHGKVLALLAGPPSMLLGQFGVAPVVAAAAIPVLTALLTQIIKSMGSKGELDANVHVQAQIPQAAMQYVQQASDTAAAAQAAYQAGQQFVDQVQNFQPPNANVNTEASFDVEAGSGMEGADVSALPTNLYVWPLLFGGVAAGLGLWSAIRR